jgi:5-methyltetrahydropteroyltriglutamate--homocysteine methyltransferase
MIRPANLGFPRLGPRRELKKLLEDFWSGASREEDLLRGARDLRRGRWETQARAGIEVVPSNDFSLYDHVLDTAVLVGAIPRRFGGPEIERIDLRAYFALARGGPGAPAPLGMTKWFDTNYHYLVPEFEPETRFRLGSAKPVDEFLEALSIGVRTRPVLLGPVTFLRLGREVPGGGPGRWERLDGLLDVYEEVLARLAAAGAEWVQMDEPCLVLDAEPGLGGALRRAYERLAGVSARLKILLASYFGGLGENLEAALRLPVAGWHFDLVRGGGEIDRILAEAPAGRVLSLGLVDGRNVWRTDLLRAQVLLALAREKRGAEFLQVAPSCSLLHVPLEAGRERGLPAELRRGLAFALEKLEEVVLLARALNEGPGAVREELDRAARAREALGRAAGGAAAPAGGRTRRASPYAARSALQKRALGLPDLPTTTIGSLPQTPEVRAARASFRAGRWTAERYRAFLRDRIDRALRVQEEIGLDLLVHGEFERGDMVEYFAELLDGFALTEHGWVQSYGSRAVKPPILHGPVRRRGPMTVEWAAYAQSRTARPVKGMLTGPVTLLQWSFVREDRPRREIAFEIAHALREEVLELERAGIRAIQVDEPALREGLPLRRAGREEYLRWAVEAFRIVTGGVRDETQIHTHMCYADFREILPAVAEMDADVLSIECSRSGMELLSAFREFRYPNGVGPGVYDVHSPRVPAAEEIEALLRRALEFVGAERLWVNPDCGLKTRRWEEAEPALRAMVEAARRVRKG